MMLLTDFWVYLMFAFLVVIGLGQMVMSLALCRIQRNQAILGRLILDLGDSLGVHDAELPQLDLDDPEGVYEAEVCDDFNDAHDERT